MVLPHCLQVYAAAKSDDIISLQVSVLPCLYVYYSQCDVTTESAANQRAIKGIMTGTLCKLQSLSLQDLAHHSYRCYQDLWRLLPGYCL